MTTKTRNEYIALVVILLILGYFVYHYFLGGSTQPAPSPVVLQNPSAAGSLASGTTGTGLVGTTPSTTGEFLPNGTTLNTSVLQNSVFTSLIPPAQFTVDPNNLGISNPFAPASSATTSAPTPSGK